MKKLSQMKLIEIWLSRAGEENMEKWIMMLILVYQPLS